MKRRRGRSDPYPVRGHAVRTWPRRPKLQHAVERVSGDGDPDRAAPVGARARPVADRAFAARDGRLGPDPHVVPRRFLPAHTALLGDEPEVMVPSRRRGLGQVAGHRRRARWDDDVHLRAAFGHVGVNAPLIVRAIAGERGDRVFDPVETAASPPSRAARAPAPCIRAARGPLGPARRRNAPRGRAMHPHSSDPPVHPPTPPDTPIPGHPSVEPPSPGRDTPPVETPPGDTPMPVPPPVCM